MANSIVPPIPASWQTARAIVPNAIAPNAAPGVTPANAAPPLAGPGLPTNEPPGAGTGKVDWKKLAGAKPKPPAAKPKPAPKPKPKPQSATDKYLAGDTTYQQQLAEFNKSQSDYNSTYNTQKGITVRDYNTTKRQMNVQGQQDRLDQQNDFGGRGILHSGVFAQALGKYNTDFNTRMNSLSTGETDKLGDLGTQKTSFLRQLQLQKNAAKQDAIKRRADKLGI